MAELPHRQGESLGRRRGRMDSSISRRWVGFFGRIPELNMFILPNLRLNSRRWKKFAISYNKLRRCMYSYTYFYMA
jgi:hypothetical protein